MPHGTYDAPGYVMLAHDSPDVSSSGMGKVLLYDPVKESYTNKSYAYVHSFNDSIYNISHELYPSVFYSSKDAIDTHLARLETNNLENLSALSEVSDLIEPVKGFISLVKEIRQGDVLGTLLAALDLLTSAKLVYEYGISPTRADAEEIATKALPIFNRVRSFNYFQDQTLYGKFSYDIPNDFIPGFPECHLTARSKIVGHLDPNSYLAALLPVRSFGLLPSLSAMWDLVPWSFAVDWFANIGDRLSDVDTSAEMLAFNIKYSTHTIMVEHGFEEQILRDNGVYPLSSSDDIKLTYYVRSVMQRIPSLTYSKLDFREANGVPDWLTAFSLVFKLFR
jgi:hypothetical protein